MRRPRWRFRLVTEWGFNRERDVVAASWFAARVIAAQLLGCDPQDLVTVRRGGK